MSVGNWLRIALAVVGVCLLWMTLSSLAKRKFTDGFSMAWALLSVLFILAGILLNPAGISNYVSTAGIIIIFVVGLGVLFMLWSFSREISRLSRKNHELAMQLSLLNQEHYQIQKLLEKMTEKDANDLWR